MINVVIRAGLGVLLTFAVLGCSPKKSLPSEAAQPPLSVDLQLDPTPARVGTERITVIVRDRTGATVTGAMVSILPSFESVPGGHAKAVPDMGRALKAVPAADAGDGVYHADIELTKAAHWIFVSHVSAAQTQTMATRDLDVR